VNDIRKFDPAGKRDPLLVLAEEGWELRREQHLLQEETARTSDRLNS
jgi:hypothetical protein